MKLDPVYLLAPGPPARPARRNHVVTAWVAVTFALGLALGVGVAKLTDRGASETSAGSTEILRWALRTQEGPIDGLIRQEEMFRIALRHTRDQRLIRGLEKLVAVALDEAQEIPAERSTLADTLVREIETTPLCASLAHFVPSLRLVR